MSPAWAIIIITSAVVVYAWAQSTGSFDTTGELTMTSWVTERIAGAIAKAEGFLVPGSLPQRANNPGNLKLGGETIGGKTIFSTVQEGWQALYHQIDLMLSGQSRYYSPDMTIRQVAGIYTGHDNEEAWAKIVAGQLGVSPDTPIGSIA